MSEELEQIAQQIANLNGEIALLEAQLIGLRQRAAFIVEDMGGRAEAAGLAFTLTEESVRVSYDARAIDGIVVSLTALTQEIAALRRSSVVKPTLRISKVKV